MREKTLKKRVVTPAMLLVTIGVVYGDIGTSPMYVLKSIIENNGGLQTVNRAFIIGSLSLIIWTVTLITTVKYVVVAMKADNNGEGGIFALYSLVKNYGKYLVIPAMLPGIAAAFALVFLNLMKELTATLLLTPNDIKTLSTAVWEYTSDAQYAAATPYAIMLVLFSGIPVFLLKRYGFK